MKEKCEMVDLARKVQKQEDLFRKACERSLSTWNKSTIYYIYHIPYTIMQKSEQNMATLYCMVTGTAKAFLKHMFLTCCITTGLTKCLDTRNRTFFRLVFSSSCLLTHSTPFSSSTKSRSIISVWLWSWYRTIQDKSKFLLDFRSQENLVPYLNGRFD